MVIKCPKKKKIFTLLSRFVDSESRHVERTLQEMEDFSPIGSAILNKSGVILPFSSGWSILHWIHNNSHNEKHHLYICSWSKRSPQCCLTLSTSLLEVLKLRVLTGLNWESGDDWLSGGLNWNRVGHANTLLFRNFPFVVNDSQGWSIMSTIRSRYEFSEYKILKSK